MVGQSPNFDWSILSTLLTSSSTIPRDIKFKVVDKEDGLVTTLEAHKFILALHSDHFNNAFFGSGVNFKEEEEGVVVIKDATKEAFEDFLGFNYEKKIAFEKKTLRELYDILNLAERYQVEELKDAVCNFIQNFPLSIDNVVESAATAQEFLHFENASQALFASCVAFTKTQFTNVDSVLTFVQRHDDETTVMKLLKEVKVPADSPKCSNCQQKPCRYQSDILAQDLLMPGMVVRTNHAVWVEKFHFRLCKLISASSGRISVSWSILPGPAGVANPFETNLIVSGGHSNFKYACNK